VIKGKRYAVFSLRTCKSGSIWTRAGSAWVNKDDSINVYLDVLPIDGKLHIREEVKGGPVKGSAVPDAPDAAADFGDEEIPS